MNTVKVKGLRPNVNGIRSIRWFVFVLLVGFLLFILLAFRETDSMLEDPDTYWHIATGRMIWQTGSFPRVDEFSYTFQGHPWIAENWLAELMLFGAYSFASWRGVIVLTTCVVVSSYALLYLALSRQMRLTVAVGIVTAAVAFSVGHFTARPQIFVDGLMILWVASLVRAVESKTSPSLLLVPIATLWANLHPIVTIGLALAGGLAVEAVLYSPGGERIRTAGRWAPFLALAAVAACITPYGYDPILHAFQSALDQEAVPHVQEWIPVTIKTLGVNELLLLGLLFLALYKGVKIPAWRLLMVIGLFYLMMSHIRFASLFAFVTPILLAPVLTRQFPFLRLSAQIEQDPQFFLVLGRIARPALYPVCGLILFGVLADVAWGGTVAPYAKNTPAGAVDYMNREHFTEHIYNPYDFGGYLIFRGVKTFIDGRTEQLFLGGFTGRLFEILNLHPKKFLPLMDEYKVKVALVVPGSPESEELAASENWGKVYSDNVAEVYKKRD
jgi:hypothetical protein